MSTPLKSVTIPRVGLTATLVSVKTGPILCWELEYDYSGLTARSSLGTFPTVHIASMCLSPTESNRYGTAHDLISGSMWKQLRIQQTMLHMGYMHSTWLTLNVGGMAQNFIRNHLRTRSFLIVQIPHKFLQMILKWRSLPWLHKVKSTFHCLNAWSAFPLGNKAKRVVAVCLCLQKRCKRTGSDEQGQLKSGDAHTDVAKEKAKTQVLNVHRTKSCLLCPS